MNVCNLFILKLRVKKHPKVLGWTVFLYPAPRFPLHLPLPTAPHHLARQLSKENAMNELLALCVNKIKLLKMQSNAFANLFQLT